MIKPAEKPMARKMGVRGRPGLFFITILAAFLIIFFLTWRSMFSSKSKNEPKDIFTMNFQQHARQGDRNNDFWQRAKILNGEDESNEADVGKDEDYNFKFKSSQSLNSGKQSEVKSPLADLLHQSDTNHVHLEADTPVTKAKSTVPVQSEPYYKVLNESHKIIGSRFDRLIHLDLKGAAPKLSYFKEVFPLFSRLGATGLMIEYEDMFPYSGKLQALSAKNAYTKDQISKILGLAKLNSLKVIPLIQTFGHMEYVLKALHLKGLRESEYTPQVINIASNDSYSLIQDMVSQVLDAHPSVSYLHIGCDEVYELGRGRSADIMVREKLTQEKMFLRHVKRVAEIVLNVGKKRVRPIIWDDELRKMEEKDILAANLPSLVDIMVWRYTQNISDKLTEKVWEKYGRLFKLVWAASSFKGATGSRQVYTEPKYHIINHFSWMDSIAKYSKTISFKGIALTGWSRFDHFATLCELLPVAIPSLAVCLASIRNGGFDKNIHKTTSVMLGCSGLIEMEMPRLNDTERSAIVSQDCRFPGHMVYYGIQQLWGYKQFQETSRRVGWLSDYQVHRRFSNPGQLKVLRARLGELTGNLNQVRTPLTEFMNKIYSPDTVEEWLDENIYETQREIDTVQGKVTTMINQNHWQRRGNLSVIKQSTVPPVNKVEQRMPSNDMIKHGNTENDANSRRSVFNMGRTETKEAGAGRTETKEAAGYKIADSGKVLMSSVGNDRNKILMINNRLDNSGHSIQGNPVKNNILDHDSELNSNTKQIGGNTRLLSKVKPGLYDQNKIVKTGSLANNQPLKTDNIDNIDHRNVANSQSAFDQIKGNDFQPTKNLNKLKSELNAKTNTFGDGPDGQVKEMTRVKTTWNSSHNSDELSKRRAWLNNIARQVNDKRMNDKQLVDTNRRMDNPLDLFQDANKIDASVKTDLMNGKKDLDIFGGNVKDRHKVLSKFEDVQNNVGNVPDNRIDHDKDDDILENEGDEKNENTNLVDEEKKRDLFSNTFKKNEKDLGFRSKDRLQSDLKHVRETYNNRFDADNKRAQMKAEMQDGVNGFPSDNKKNPIRNIF